MRTMIHAFERVQEILGTDTFAYLQFQFELDKVLPVSPDEFGLAPRFGEHGWQPQGGFGRRLALFLMDIGGAGERAELIVQAAKNAKQVADEARARDKQRQSQREQGKT